MSLKFYTYLYILVRDIDTIELKMTYSSVSDLYQTYLTKLQDYSRTNIENSASNALYVGQAFDAYIWGYSFEWLYAKQQMQVNGAGGSRGVNVPLNSFYINSQPTVTSTGKIAPDVAVLYANGFLNPTMGSPVVVQYPNTSSSGQFVMMQVSNSATENLTSLSSYINSNGNAGGNYLFYQIGDPNIDSYKGNFVAKIPVNTEIVLLTGRVLVDPVLTDSAYPLALQNSQSIASQFVAADYKQYAANGYTMEGLTNSSQSKSSLTKAQLTLAENNYNSSALVPITPVSPDNKANFAEYGTSFWANLGAALVQSPLPTVGPGTGVDFVQQTPQQYLATLSKFGLSSKGWAPNDLTKSQLADLVAVANYGYEFIENLSGLAATLSGSSWSNVPAGLGAYPNNAIGYLERDIAHVANSPNVAVYPTLFRDSEGNFLSGSSTYTLTLKNLNGKINTPPLAPGAKVNVDGFWAFNAYDTNLNITPAISNYSTNVNKLLGYTPDVVNTNTNSVNYTVSSILLPNSEGYKASVPTNNQLFVEPNGDIVLIMAPEAPKDTKYLNNWIPTPLITYNDGNFVVGDIFNMMLRVYTPNISTSIKNGDAFLVDNNGNQWVIPKVVKADGAANVTQLANGSIGSDATFINSPRADNFKAGAGINSAVYQGKIDQYTIQQLPSNTIKLTENKSSIIDSLENISRLDFTDTNIALDVGAGQSAGILFRVYKAALGRTPDVNGAASWLNALDKKMPSKNFANSIINSSEFLAKNGANQTDLQFIDLLYKNALGRSASTAEAQPWITALSSGMTKSEISIAIAESDESVTFNAKLIGQGLKYADLPL